MHWWATVLMWNLHKSTSQLKQKYCAAIIAPFRRWQNNCCIYMNV